MATFLSPQRLEEIRQKVQGGQIKIPEFGTATLPDSPATGISASGKIIEISTGQVLGSLEQIQGTFNYRATPITPADLEPVAPLTPATAQVSPPTDISGLIEGMQLTSEEKEESDINKRIKQLREQLAEKPEFEITKTKEFGVEANKQAFEDLSRQLRDIQREEQLVPRTIQEQSKGRGRTEAGIEPLEIGRRRALVYDALVMASRIDAAQGLLASSERKVLQAVQNKFASIEAQLDKELADAKMVRESPEASLQDKKRALKLEADIQTRKDEITKTIEEQKEILKSVNEAARNLFKRGEATPEANLELDRIGKTAKTNLEALIMLAPYLEESRLAGTSAERQTFATLHPELKVGTEEFKVAWDKYQAEKPPTGLGDFEQAFLRDKGRLPTVTELLEFKKQAGEAGRKPEVEDLTGDEAIDAWAQRINSGTDKVSSVPNNIRNKVVVRVKEFAEQALKDLEEDISLGFEQNLTPEALVTQLEIAYPEFTRSEITNKVTELKPQATTEKPQGFFSKIGSFFGSLFR